METQGAIKVLKSLEECLSIDCHGDCEHCHIQLDGITAVVEACAVAVTELSQPDTDTISRQMAIAEIARWIGYIDEDMISRIQTGLKKLPSAQPKKRTEERTETHACDYISRQAAIDAFLTELTKRERKNLLHTWSTVEVKYFVVEMLERLPSVQPELIRCKDCKYWREGTVYTYCDKLYGMGVLDVYDYMTAEDDYCSRAERRTDERSD